MIAIRVTDDAGDLHVLDLYEAIVPKLTYQFKDIRGLSAVLGGFSDTFRVPATKNNVAFFGPLYDPTASTSYATKKKKPAILEWDTVPVFTGFLRLVSVVMQKGQYSEFEVSLFGEVPTLAKDLGDDSLKDIDFSALDHSLTFNNVVASWSDSLLSGKVVYGFADYGVRFGMGPDSWRKIDTVDGALDPSHLKPCVQMKEVVDTIFDHVGWTYESTFLTSTPFTKLFMPWVDHAGERMETIAASSAAKWGLLSDDTYTLTGSYTNPGWADETTPFYDPDGLVSAGVFTAAADGVHYVTLQMSVAADPTGSGSAEINFCLFKGGALVPGTEQSAVVGLTWGGAVPVTYAIAMESGDSLDVRVRGTGVVTFIGDGSLSGSGCFVQVVPPAAFGSSDMTLFAPEAKATDLLSDLITLFNLVFVPVEGKEKHVKIEPFSDFIATGDVVDWSGKLDVEKDYQITPAAEFQKKQIVLTYLKDEDYLSQQVSGSVRDDGERIYGEKVINNDDNDFATGVEKISTKVFASTPLGQVEGSIAVAPMYWDADGAPIKPKPRLLYWGGLTTLGGSVAVSSGTTTGTVTGVLSDSGADFTGDGVEVGDRVDNTTDGTFTFVTAVSSGVALVVADDIFTSGEGYAISRNNGWLMNHPDGYAVAFDEFPYMGQYETFNSGLDDVDLAFGVENPFHYTAFQTYNTLFYAYWQRYLQETYSEDGRVLSAFFRLTLADMVSLKFNDRIYCLGAEWRINKITGYGPGVDEPVKVELVKIISARRCEWVPDSVGDFGVVTMVDSGGTTGAGTKACCELFGYIWNSDDSECISRRFPQQSPTAGIPIGGGTIGTDPGAGIGSPLRVGMFPSGRLGAMGGIGSGLFTGRYHSVGGFDHETAGYGGVFARGSNALILHDGEDAIGGGWLRSNSADPEDEVAGRAQAGRLVLMGEGTGTSVGDKITLRIQGRSDGYEFNVPDNTVVGMRVFLTGFTVSSGAPNKTGMAVFHALVIKDRSNVTTTSVPIEAHTSIGDREIKNLRLDLSVSGNLVTLAAEVHASGTTFSDTAHLTAEVNYTWARLR
jgi:hypothetical protein